MYKRLLENDFIEWIQRDEILILTWARQVGKSSFLKYIQSRLEYETAFYNLEDFTLLNIFNETPKNLVKLLKENYDLTDKIYVFIDEIQYLKDPTQFLKFIYDEYKDKIKLIVSWSSAFYIDKNFKDSLAGRKKIFHMKPLNFKEFLIFKNEEKLIWNLSNFQNLTQITKDTINSYFDEYLLFWWYPRIVLENNFSIKKELIWELVNSYVKKDIAESKIDYPQKFYNLYKILSSQTWQLLNVNELSNSLDLSVSAVNNYIYILRKTFHFYEIRPFFKKIRKELTKMPKIFIQDLWIKNYFEKNFNNIEDRLDKWAIFETVVFNELCYKYSIENINFWRTQDKKEIDFIIQTENQKIAIEVKYKNQKVNFGSFLSSYKDFEGKVITRDNIFELL